MVFNVAEPDDPPGRQGGERNNRDQDDGGDSAKLVCPAPEQALALFVTSTEHTAKRPTKNDITSLTSLREKTRQNS